MRVHKKGDQIRFDPAEVPGLLEKAKAGDIEARNELLFRFQRLVSTLVNVCITGRPNYWSSYQKTFLRLFAGKTVPVQNTAIMLKRELSSYEKEELFSTGQLAVLLAVEKCETNFATTIVICFKDLIHRMIKDPSNRPGVEIDTETPTTFDVVGDTSFRIFLQQLDDKEYGQVQKLLDGEKVSNISPTLKAKAALYFDIDNNIE